MLRNRFLGGVSSLVCYAPEDGAGGGAGGDGGAGSGPGGAGGTIAGGGERVGGAGAGGAGAGAAAAGAAGAGVAAGAVGGTGNEGGATQGAAAGDGAAGQSQGGADKGAVAAGDPAKPGAEAAKPGTEAATKPTFPEDWRAQLAGGDKAALKQLDRFASPKALWDSLKQLQTKISAGELKPVKDAPGADAKPEEVAAWRKEQGLPETPDAYAKDLKLGDGLVLPDADKPMVDNFAAIAHKSNIPQAAFNSLVEGYYALQDQQAAARREADSTFHDESLSQLSQEWGTETKTNQRAIANLLETAPGGLAPDGLGTQILLARLPNGRLLGDDPGACRYLTQLSRDLNPVATIVPPGTQNAGAFVASRITEIEKMMGDNRSNYWRGPESAKIQQEYRDLVDAQSKMKARA